MATSLTGKSTIDSIVQRLERLHILAEPRPEQLPIKLFECYCEAHARYKVPVSEYAGGVQSFIEETLRNMYDTAKTIYDEDSTRSIRMGSEHWERITQKIGEQFYGNKQTEQA